MCGHYRTPAALGRTLTVPRLGDVRCARVACTCVMVAGDDEERSVACVAERCCGPPVDVSAVCVCVLLTHRRNPGHWCAAPAGARERHTAIQGLGRGLRPSFTRTAADEAADTAGFHMSLMEFADGR